MIELILVSLLSGMMCGIGGGGGILLIPALTWLGWAQITAQAANLISYLPAALVAVWQHARARRVRWKTTLWLIIGGVPAAVGGSYLAEVLSGTDWLRRIFGVFLILMAIREWRCAGRTTGQEQKK